MNVWMLLCVCVYMFASPYISSVLASVMLFKQTAHLLRNFISIHLISNQMCEENARPPISNTFMSTYTKFTLIAHIACYYLFHIWPTATMGDLKFILSFPLFNYLLHEIWISPCSMLFKSLLLSLLVLFFSNLLFYPDIIEPIQLWFRVSEQHTHTAKWIETRFPIRLIFNLWWYCRCA